MTVPPYYSEAGSDTGDVFCITVNVDAEQFWLRVDPTATDRPKTLSLGQYGITRGLPRLLEMFDIRGVSATFFVPGIVATMYPQSIQTICCAGHEVASRSWDLTALVELPDPQRSIRDGICALEDVTQRTIAGFRAPPGGVTSTYYQDLVANDLKWSSTMHDSDHATEVISVAGDIVELSTRWELVDVPYFQFNYEPAFPAGQGRLSAYRQVFNGWAHEAAANRAWGIPTVLTIAPDVSGKPGRSRLLGELIATMQQAGMNARTVGSLCGFDGVHPNGPPA